MLVPDQNASPGDPPCILAQQPREVAPHEPSPRVQIDRQSELACLLPFSPHKIHYELRSYPTGMHLYESFKFLPARPDLAEHIRRRGTSEEGHVITHGLTEYWRQDWDEVADDRMDEVLYLKLLQHPDLRALLLQTGTTEIVFSDEDQTWGVNLESGEGLNRLGHALMRVRARFRAEGVDGCPPPPSPPRPLTMMFDNDLVESFDMNEIDEFLCSRGLTLDAVRTEVQRAPGVNCFQSSGQDSIPDGA